MSTPDEMGLTPDAALGYEEFFVPAIFHQWPERIISAADISKSDDVLDVGCGTGALTRELARCTGRVTGFDLSESMLRRSDQISVKRFDRQRSDRLGPYQSIFNLPRHGRDD